MNTRDTNPRAGDNKPQRYYLIAAEDHPNEIFDSIKAFDKFATCCIADRIYESWNESKRKWYRCAALLVKTSLTERQVGACAKTGTVTEAQTNYEDMPF